MLSFLRRIINSRVGVAVTLGFLVLVAVLFGLGDVLGSKLNGGASGDTAADVGHQHIAARELRQQADAVFQRGVQQQPGLTQAAFVAQGGLEATLERMIGDLAFDEFGRQQGMVVTKKLEDGEIASLPQLQDATGQFDQNAYGRLLQQLGLSDQQLHTIMRQSIMSRMLNAPTRIDQPVPNGMAQAYASILLEQRQGQIAIIPSAAVPAGPAPTDAEVAAFYGQHRERYVIPERRSIRYALVTADAVKARATPSDAELAAEYNSRRADFAATEKRSLVQVTVLDQKGAADLAAKVRGGTDIAAAARAAGLEPQTFASLSRDQLAKQTSPDVAAAAFGAARGGVIGPVRAAVGFVVGKVTDVQQVAGKSLEQARAQLVDAVTARKTQALLGQIRAQVEDALNGKANFSEAAAPLHVPAATTAPLTVNGIDPDQPAAKPDSAIAPLIAAAFQSEPDDPPALVPVGQDGSFALVALDRVIAPAPPPLAKIRDVVARDVQQDRASRTARQVAQSVLTKVNAGTPLAQAIAGTALKVPAPKPIGGVRGQVTAGGTRVPPPLAFLFSMTPGTTRILDVPGGAGWYIIRLDKVTPGDARSQPALTTRIAGEFAGLVGREQADEFARAVQAEVKVSRNAAAIAKVKADMSGQGGQPD